MRKSFKDNPALHFITAGRPPEPSPEADSPPETPAAAPANASAAVPADVPAKRPTTRPQAPPPAGPPLKPDPRYVETRSRRLQLLLQPSLHHRLTQAARKDGRSLNDLIHSILDDWTG